MKWWQHLFGTPDAPDAPEVTYEDMRARVRDFDVFLWSGKNLGSRFIKWATRSWASHVSLAMIATEQDLLLNYESTTMSKTPDWFTKQPRSGSQVNTLSTRIAEYGAPVYWRPIIGPRPQAVLDAFRQSRRITSGIPYEQSWWEFIGAGVSAIKNRENRSSLFCSELVAWVLGNVGVADLDRPSNEYTPEAFTEKKTPDAVGVDAVFTGLAARLSARPRYPKGSVVLREDWCWGPEIRVLPPVGRGR